MGYLFLADGSADNRRVAVVPRSLQHPERCVRKGFSALEWSVVALARGDLLSTLEKPGRVAIAMGGLFGVRHNPCLADPRLEALRRIAVLCWHHRLASSDTAITVFIEAGFDAEQYSLMIEAIDNVLSGILADI